MGLHFAKKINEKDFPYQEKNCQKWVLNLGQNGQNSYFLIFYYIKILTKDFEKKFFTYEGEKRGEFFDEN